MLPSLTRVRNFLKKCVVNPREPGSIHAMIVDRDHEYLVQRAEEFLREVKLINKSSRLTIKGRIQAAVELLGVAGAMLDGPEED
jgi:hypothetical protein